MNTQKIYKITILICVPIIFFLLFVLTMNSLYECYGNVILLQSTAEYESITDKLTNVGVPYRSTEFSIEETDVEAGNRVLQNASVYYVDDSYEILNNPEILLGSFSPSETCVVIDYSTAISLFATRDCIGKSLTIADKQYTIVGVVRLTNIISKWKYELQEATVYVGMDAYDESMSGISFCCVRSRPELLPMIYHTFCSQENINVYEVYKEVESLIHTAVITALIYIFTLSYMMISRNRKEHIIGIIFYLAVCVIILYCMFMLIYQPEFWQINDLYKYKNSVIPVTADVVILQCMSKIISNGCLMVVVSSIIYAHISISVKIKYKP